MKNCKNCIWADGCKTKGVPCYYYEPAFEGEAEKLLIQEYEDSLEERQEEYLLVVKEQQE